MQVSQGHEVTPRGLCPRTINVHCMPASATGQSRGSEVRDGRAEDERTVRTTGAAWAGTRKSDDVFAGASKSRATRARMGLSKTLDRRGGD
jgi:hypothetical protein